ncbi:Pkinase-domain-containing protein [Hysterangium stoloniferum]|nr:Pkinase-domain-containing protein [Hysterangium stoloniferum]
MLKLWSNLADQTTPKASAIDRNPFDAPRLNPAAASDPNSHSLSQPTISGSPRTTSALSHHHHLLNTQQPSNGSGTSTPLELGPLTPAAANNFAAVAAALPTTHLSLKPPDFNMKQPPLPRNLSKPSTLDSPPPSNSSVPSTTPAKGQLHVKLIQARGLNVQSNQARPYVVVQFEQNEFVSREATSETEKEVKGVPTNTSRNGSSTALSALGAVSIGKAFEAAARARATTPSSSVSSGKSAIALSKAANFSADSAPTSGTATPSVFGGPSAHNPVWKHEVSFDVTSDRSMITINVYDRRHDTERSFLGTLQIKPVLLHDHTVDQWYKLRPFENEVVTGEIRMQVTYEQLQSKYALTPRDFEVLKLIGRGTFGRVFQVRKRDTKRIYAMKVLSKKEIVAKKEVAHTIGERKILQRSLESPFLVGLKFSFQTDTELYLVTDFKSGGELFWHLQRENRFTEDRARFYIAELILALEHLHKYNIVYRDLKPENILLDATGHVALCDFGLSKPDLPSDQLTNTFCGTTEYLAPEVLLDDHGYSKLVDFWSLGVLLFEMCCGWSPFYAEDTQQMYKNICFGKIRFPKGVIGEDGKLFVKGLLNRNPKHRLGAINDAAELKAHPFFKSIDWEALSRKQVTPPFRPNVESDESTTNFDPEFTTADLREHGIDSFDDDLDEDDPSEHWVASASVTANNYAPNGPLGSETNQAISSLQTNTKAVAIEKRRRRRQEAAGSPLTNSVQENFRGFTFSGEQSLHPESWLSERAQKDVEEAVEEARVDMPDPDDVDDDSAYAGRYARRRDMEVDDQFA